MRDGRGTEKGERETVGGRPQKSQKPCGRRWEVESRREKRKDSRAQRSRAAETWREERSVRGRGRGTARMLPAWERCLDRLHPGRGLNHSPHSLRGCSVRTPSLTVRPLSPVFARLLLPRSGLYRDSQRRVAADPAPKKVSRATARTAPTSTRCVCRHRPEEPPNACPTTPHRPAPTTSSSAGGPPGGTPSPLEAHVQATSPPPGGQSPLHAPLHLGCPP